MIHHFWVKAKMFTVYPVHVSNIESEVMYLKIVEMFWELKLVELMDI